MVLLAETLNPEDCNTEVEFIYQTVENSHKASLDHTGDWYFTDNDPTTGDNKVVNTSLLISTKEKKDAHINKHTLC